MTSLLLLGAPGAGKGTQAALISDKFGIPAISTGEIFRANIQGETELGRKAKDFIDRGEFVPDSVTTPMVQLRLQAEDAQDGFLLDGYPRTLEQAHALRDMLAENGKTLDVVIDIRVDEDQTVARMLHRAKEEHRTDDTEPVFRNRLKKYHEYTEPMATYYADQGLLKVVDGNGTIDEVFDRIAQILNALN